MTPQLTPNDLCGYLPFDLKFTSELDKPKEEFGINPIWTFEGITYLFGDYCLSTKENQDAYPIHLCKPIFRNLATDLTRGITHGNETFVPIRVIHDLEVYGWSELEYYIDNNLEINVDALPYRLIKKLQEWHFWLGDQSYFEKGIVLDYNDVNGL